MLLGGTERFEQLRLDKVATHATTAVDHLNHRARWFTACIDPNRAAWWRRFKCVLYQMADDALESVPMGDHLDPFSGRIDVQQGLDRVPLFRGNRCLQCMGQ